MSDMFERLASPFDPSEVDWRVGSMTKDKTKGMALAYVDARTVMDRLDTVCGPAGWQNRYVMEGTKTVCEIGIKCDGEWVWKADGAGDSDIEAEKGALSDAFKRAAVRWGIGRYLYNMESPWVELKAFGNSYAIADKAPLVRLLSGKMPKGNQSGPEDTALQAAKAFVRKAIAETGEAKTLADLSNWLHVWGKHVEKLRTSYPDEGRAVDAAINAQRQALKLKDAAE
jgi:hypothetical protein